MKTKSIIIVLLIFAAPQIFSQTGSVGVKGAKSSGMAGVSAISSDGLFAIGNNPANLFQNISSKKFEFIIPLPLPAVSAKAGSNFFNLDDYNYFFGNYEKDKNGKNLGRYLTDADKNRLKDLFSDGGTVMTDAYVTLFGIAVTPNRGFGTLAFSINDIVSGRTTFPKDIISLGMDGNLPNRVYNFNDTELTAWWLRKYGFSYSRSLSIFPMFREFSFGVTFNIVQGFAYAGLDNIKTELTTGENNVITGNGEFLAYSAFSDDFHVKYDFDSLKVKQDAEFSMFPESAGSGIGFDFGFNAKVNEIWSIGFAVTDIGKVKWNKNVAEFKSNKPIYLDDLTDKEQRDSLIDNLTGKGSGRYISEITTDLATALRFGIALQLDRMFTRFPGRMLVAVEFNKGFNDQPGNSSKSQFVIGTDWKPGGAFAFRTGFAFGGIDKFGWALGVGMDFGILEMNIGTPDMQYVVAPNNAKRITVALDSRWKF